MPRIEKINNKPQYPKSRPPNKRGYAALEYPPYPKSKPPRYTPQYVHSIAIPKIGSVYYGDKRGYLRYRAPDGTEVDVPPKRPNETKMQYVGRLWHNLPPEAAYTLLATGATAAGTVGAAVWKLFGDDIINLGKGIVSKIKQGIQAITPSSVDQKLANYGSDRQKVFSTFENNVPLG